MQLLMAEDDSVIGRSLLQGLLEAGEPAGKGTQHGRNSFSIASHETAVFDALSSGKEMRPP